jgi:hypothetical protein
MVNVECLCPPTPAGETRHPDGDTIELRERLDFRSLLAARNAMGMLYIEDDDVTEAEIYATLTESYMLLGVCGWTVVDAKGKAVPVNKPAIREYLFTNDQASLVVSDAADALYRERIIVPLVQAALKLSPVTRTNGSTSATNGTSPKNPKRSKRSSTSTTRTAGTAKTSPSLDGDSRSSLSST